MRFVLKIVARGRDAVEWRPKRGQNRSFCEVKKLINFIPILHARYEGSSDRGGALKPPPMGLGSYWALVDTKKNLFGPLFEEVDFWPFGHLAAFGNGPKVNENTFLGKSAPRIGKLRLTRLLIFTTPPPLGQSQATILH